MLTPRYHFGFIKTAIKAGVADCFASLGLLPGADPCRLCNLLLRRCKNKQKIDSDLNFDSLKEAFCGIE